MGWMQQTIFLKDIITTNIRLFVISQTVYVVNLNYVNYPVPFVSVMGCVPHY